MEGVKLALPRNVMQSPACSNTAALIYSLVQSQVVSYAHNQSCTVSFRM